MSRRIIRRPRARQDLIDLALYIGRRDPTAAERLLNAVERSERMLVDMPGIGSTRDYGPIEGMRMWPVPGFRKHLIFYRPIDDGIEVIRVLHGARDIAGLFDDDQ